MALATSNPPAESNKKDVVPDAFDAAKNNTEHKPGEPPPEVKRDQWGRYLLPDPDNGGKLRSWTRATTFANTVADQYNIDLYHQRLVAKGVAMRPDLYAEAAGMHVDDKKNLQRVAGLAMEAAGSSAKARLGTALHRFTEQYDLGEKVDAPDPWASDVAAYAKKMAEEKIQVRRQFIEAVVIVPEFGVAGTLDRIVGHDSWELDRIGDLKTGHSVHYAWMEIACQLFLYANATHWYDVKEETLHEMPSIDKSRALVIHLPVQDSECNLFEINLDLGRRVAMASDAVRGLRKRKDFSVPWEGSVTQAVGLTTSDEAVTGTDDDGWEDEPASGPPSSTTTAPMADDDWGDDDEPSAKKAPSAAKKTSAKKAQPTKKSPAEALVNVESRPELPQEWVDAGIDRSATRRFQRAKIANKKYIVVDVDTAAHEIYPLLRDARTRIDDLEDSLIDPNYDVRPVGAPKDSPPPAPVVSEDDFDEWDAETAGDPPKPDAATVTPEDKATSPDDDDWGDGDGDDEVSEEQPKRTAADDARRLRAEIDKIRADYPTPGDTDPPADGEQAPAEEEKGKKNDWMAQILEAPDDAALNDIWKAAKAAGEWNERLTKAGRRRREEIAEEAARKAAEEDDEDWD